MFGEDIYNNMNDDIDNCITQMNTLTLNKTHYIKTEMNNIYFTFPEEKLSKYCKYYAEDIMSFNDVVNLLNAFSNIYESGYSLDLDTIKNNRCIQFSHNYGKWWMLINLGFDNVPLYEVYENYL